LTELDIESHNAYENCDQIADEAGKDWIIIESFSWGVGETGAARGPGDITITKMVDKASPQLAECVDKGSNFRDVTFEFKRTDGKPGYMSYMLKNLKIVSRTLSPDGKTLPST
jgi:type VI secretion system Hcp family effector